MNNNLVNAMPLKVIKEPEWLSELDQAAIASLRNNMARVVTGLSNVIMSNIFDNTPDEKILEWTRSTLSEARVSGKLLEMEEANADKFGPRSIAKAWSEREDSLRSYFDHDFDGSVEDSMRALSPGAANLSSGKVAIDKFMQDSNSGLPFMRKKKFLKSLPPKEFQGLVGRFPCVLFTRTQEKGKTRNVFGYGIGDTWNENRGAIPYLKLDKSMRERKAVVSPDAVDEAMTLALLSKSSTAIVYSVDFENFDASVTPQQIISAFSTISRYFAQEHHSYFVNVCERFLTIPIYTPSGEFTGVHGIPSGSSFTNAIGSQVQIQIGDGYAEPIQVQGDDGVYFVESNELDQFEANWAKNNLKLNTQKSYVTDEKSAVYLQKLYHPDYRKDGARSGQLGGVYPITRALNRIKYPERWTDISKDEKITGRDWNSLRAIMILETCRHHPLFEKLVKYVYDSDKYSLEFSRKALPSFFRLIEPRVKAGVYHGPDVKGIESFRTMHVIRSIA